MAQEFYGLLNDGEKEDRIRLILQFEFNLPVILDLFINNDKKNFKLGYDKIIMDDSEYNYKIKHINDETIIAGKEVSNIYQYIAPCIFPQKYFTLTNKMRDYIDI